MNLSTFRVSAGHYEVNHYTILNGGRGFWQVRDQLFDEIIEDFPTLREALRYAQTSKG